MSRFRGAPRGPMLSDESRVQQAKGGQQKGRVERHRTSRVTRKRLAPVCQKESLADVHAPTSSIGLDVDHRAMIILTNDRSASNLPVASDGSKWMFVNSVSSPIKAQIGYGFDLKNAAKAVASAGYLRHRIARVLRPA